MSIAASFGLCLDSVTYLETHYSSERFLTARRPFPVKRSKVRITTISGPRTVSVKCSSDMDYINGSGDGESKSVNLKDALAGMVDDRVEQLLNKDKNRFLLDGLEKATLRVELARRELAEVEKQEAEAKLTRDYINQLQSRTSEIAECQKEILEAKAMVEEAELSLSKRGPENGDSFTGTGSELIDRDKERLESIKAATISAVVGTLAGLPLSLIQVSSNYELILPLGITFVSCALFGVTFRYAIRRDLDNFQLKSGTSAAFGFVKGLAMLGAGPPLQLEFDSFLSHAFDGGVFIYQSLLVFLFASIGLDLCMKLRILSPFPINNAASITKEL